MTKNTYVAKTLFGLEQLLAKEIASFGGTSIEILKRAVSFQGGLDALYRSNLHSRLALRILQPIHFYQAHHEKAFYDGASQIHWDSWLQTDQTIYIDCVAHSPWVKNTHYLRLLLKDAVCDWFREKTGKRPSINKVNPDVRLIANINQNQVQISIDTSGDALFKRGYRTRSNLAPLNEVLAAGIIALSGWDTKQPFLDGMTGSGTFLIEALLMYYHLPPGRSRHSFGFMNLPDYDPATWEKIVSEVADMQDLPYPKIYGIDIDKKAISIAKDNLRRAGFSPFHYLHQHDFFDYKPQTQPGVLLLNPPYDFRMKHEDINGFYKSIGDRLKQQYKGWKAWIFSSNLTALKHVGLASSKKIKLFNGPNESRLVLFEIY